MRSNRWRWIPVSATVLATAGCVAEGEPVPAAEAEAEVPAAGEVIRSAVSPPPILGGTLLMIEEDTAAVAADPDRDLVHVVDVVDASVRHTIELPHGSQPGRLTADARGLVHVVARGAGAVVDLDPASGSILGSRAVCPNPRGIVHEPEPDVLHVACAGGELVTLPAEGGAALRRVMVAPDLRDVFFTPDGLFVSRFRTADLLQLGDDGSVVERVGLPVLERGSIEPDGSREELRPNTAWRTIPAPRGDWLMLHQISTTRTIPVAPPPSEGDDMPDGTTSAGESQGDPSEGGFGESGGFGGVTDGVGEDDGGGGSGYGGSASFTCDAVVHPMLTLGNGTLDTKHSAAMLKTVLPVDVAVSSSRLAAMAVAGVHMALDGSEQGGVVVLNLGDFEDTNETGCILPTSVDMGGGQFVAVAFDWTGRVVAQSREPARVVIGSPHGSRPTIIELPGPPRRDTGHDLFHIDAGGGIACASCHAEGGDDGHVWRFEGLGPRHTPALAIGLAGTEPFHWQGDLADMGALVHEVHQGRMGGRPLSEDHVKALQSWMFAMTPPAPLRTREDEAVVRGEARFTAWGCNACHAGVAMASNHGFDLGVGFAVQVPGLHGVALHPPYMHDGRAADLTEAVHDMLARTRAGAPTPSDDEVGDVVAYLESL
ncbi:c-type cytochrome [Paraliomyxa miuraensis]|uniref:c-type cytochrome n=1 Tax=Paraliomyxa miuraensis TaxID=376150 RepID=UPI00225AE3F4|nr:c-type cytochrome [Paraliomyxa miuraensis]MCX4244517.1 c-type cytochrome [Paraliomyxa miuraensis]